MTGEGEGTILPLEILVRSGKLKKATSEFYHSRGGGRDDVSWTHVAWIVCRSCDTYNEI